MLSRRLAIAGDDDEDPEEFDEQDWEFEGSSFGEDVAENLINLLYVRLGSIKAGSTSSNLREDAFSLLARLVQQGVINDF